MRVQDQMVTFNVFNAIKLPSDEEECFKVDVLEAAAHSEIDIRLKTDISWIEFYQVTLNSEMKRKKNTFTI